MNFWVVLIFLKIFWLSESAPVKPENPFGENSGSSEYEDVAQGDDEYYEDESTRKPIIVSREKFGVTPAPVRENILYTILPSLQKKSYMYCPYNQYTFMITCKPGKKLRYDLKIFCQEYSDYCGVPNVNNFPARNREEWRPYGYGQKQQNGHLGLGRSFSFGLGAIPGFEITSSRGTDIANLPGLGFGGLMFNEGTDLGVLGERIGKSPSRTMDGLQNGYPSFGIDPNTAKADERIANAALRQLGIPPVPGLAKALGNLKTPGLGKKPSRLLYEPGYNAVDRNAPIATGRTDGDSVNLPSTLGNIELLHGVGMGIGKK